VDQELSSDKNPYFLDAEKEEVSNQFRPPSSRPVNPIDLFD